MEVIKHVFQETGRKLNETFMLSEILATRPTAEQLIFEQADEDLYLRHVSDLVQHSDACYSEIDYLLGKSEYDPHPDHQVVFDVKASDASRLL
jgi:hypothetical protein